MKTLLRVLSCCSLPLFAGISQNSTPSSHSKTPESLNCCMQSNPCDKVSFEFYGELLYLQPNGSSLSYAAEAFPFDSSISIPAASPNWEIFELNPKYSPGFDVGFKTLFPNTGTNLKINWERLHSHRTSSMQTPLSGDMVGPMFDIGPNSTAYAIARGEASFHFDSADFLVGKKLCLLDCFYLNLQAGAEFARIKQTLSTHYANAAGAVARNIISPSTFIGAGTKFGITFDYKLCHGLFFSGSSSLALLVGQQKNSTTYESFSPSLTTLGIPQPNTQQTTVPNRTQLIPGCEEKLGFTYDVKFTDCCHLSIGAGYQFQIYLNAIQTVNMTAPQVLPSLFVGGSVQDGVYAVGFQRTVSNFILSGPYLSVNIRF